jgi:hypothetical protein
MVIAMIDVDKRKEHPDGRIHWSFQVDGGKSKRNIHSDPTLHNQCMKLSQPSLNLNSALSQGSGDVQKTGDNRGGGI